MPPSRSASISPAARRAPARRASPPRTRIRWERKLRAVMLIVLALVSYIGIRAMVTLVQTHSQARHELNLVSELARQHHRLEFRQQQLDKRSTIMREARSLGMVGAGEKPYVVTGLKRH